MSVLAPWLSAHLRQRLEELLASRQRLVAAQDAARRRIERDLHDGAQQQLIAVNMKLGRLRAQLSRSQDDAAQSVARLQADVDTALNNLRTLSRGIYPSLLADQGITAALRSHVRQSALPVVVDSILVERCPDEVEAAAYFCVLEALQNVHRHARASRATVSLRRPDGTLHVEIADDGRGFDTTRGPTGSGLENIRDRVDALGGQFTVRSAPGAGCSVCIQIPLDRSGSRDATAS
jgi:two-component system, NarL family, sensor kinase